MRVLTKEQQKWCDDYVIYTGGFDVVDHDESVTFEKMAIYNIKWYEGHCNDMLNAIKNFPCSDSLTERN